MSKTPETETEADIERYFAAVSDALAGLDPERRADILADLRAHLAMRRREVPGGDVGRLLTELGDPQEIAAQAGLASGARPHGRDGWVIAAVVLAVLAWPIGILVAAFSARWRLRVVAWAGATPLIGWGVGILGGTVVFSSRQAVACGSTLPVGGLSRNCSVVAPALHWEALPWVHAIVAAAGGLALLLALVGTPVAAAIYLAQTIDHPAARPLVPLIALGGIALCLVITAVGTMGPIG